MAALLLEEPSADDILETLAILQAAVRAHDKDKASEVISVVLVQIMRFCTPKPGTFEKMVPLVEKLKAHVGARQFDDAEEYVLAFLSTFRQVKANLERSEDQAPPSNRTPRSRK